MCLEQVFAFFQQVRLAANILVPESIRSMRMRGLPDPLAPGVLLIFLRGPSMKQGEGYEA